MKKITLVLLAALLLSAVGCSASKSAAVKPLEDTLTVSESLPDGTYAASFQASDLKNSADGWSLTVTLADYDRFSPDVIRALKEGDSLEVCGKTVVISSVSIGEDYVEINGGYEKGGVSLSLEDDHYRTIVSDGYPLYSEVGTVTLPISEAFLCSDQKGSDPSAPPQLTGIDELPGSLSPASGSTWDFHDTRLNVAGGEIVMIYRFWTP